MPLRYSLLVLLLSASFAHAQEAPFGNELMSEWSRLWRAEIADGTTVRYSEDARQVIDGPRTQQVIETVTHISISDGGQDRRIQRATRNGRPLRAGRLSSIHRRAQRAYGAGFTWIRQPYVHPVRLMGSVQSDGRARATSVDGNPAWVVSASPGQRNDRIERVSFWFSRNEGGPPRLLRSRIVGRVPNGSAVITTVYRTFSGIDLPIRSNAEVVVRQRRRNRLFSILMNSSVTYRGFAVERD